MTSPPTTLEELDAQRRAERAAEGVPHGLSAEEVEAARATGMDLARFAAVKAAPRNLGGGRSIADVQEALRSGEAE